MRSIAVRYAGQTTSAWASSTGTQRASSCSWDNVGSASFSTRTAKTAASDDRVVGRFVELIDEVEVVERLDHIRLEPGLLIQLAQGGDRDPVAVLERAGDALPQAGQDAARRTPKEQDLGARNVPRGMDHPEDPAIDQVGAKRAHAMPPCTSRDGATDPP